MRGDGLGLVLQENVAKCFVLCALCFVLCALCFVLGSGEWGWIEVINTSTLAST